MNQKRLEHGGTKVNECIKISKNLNAPVEMYNSFSRENPAIRELPELNEKDLNARVEKSTNTLKTVKM